MGNVWATSVDYSTGHEWRVGGRILHGIPCGDCDPTEVCGPDLRCTTSDGGLSTPGVSFQSPEGRRFSLAGLERPNIWPNVPPDIEVALHQYVRVPSEALTVLLFAATSDARGETAVRYTFATEASDVPFDE